MIHSNSHGYWGGSFYYVNAVYTYPVLSYKEENPEHTKFAKELQRRYKIACLRKDKREMVQFAKELKYASTV